MRRKWIMLGVVLTSCVIVALLPLYPKTDTLVVHQHQSLHRLTRAHSPLSCAMDK